MSTNTTNRRTPLPDEGEPIRTLRYSPWEDRPRAGDPAYTARQRDRLHRLEGFLESQGHNLTDEERSDIEDQLAWVRGYLDQVGAR